MGDSKKIAREAFEERHSENGRQDQEPFTPFTPERLPKVLDFPVQAMPRACRDLIREVSASVGCPPEFVALPMLVTLGSAIGNARRLRVKGGWSEGATIFGVAVAGPGSGKSPAQDHATDPAYKAQGILRKEHRDEREDYEDRLRQYKVDAKAAEKQGEAADAPPLEPTMERTVAGDTTVEALAQILDENPRGLLINRDELSGWVRGLDQYKGGKGSDRQFYLSLWSNQAAQFDRKGQAESVFLERPLAALYGSIQPAVLSDLRDGREDGMLERFLCCYPDPVVSDWSDDEVSLFSETAYRGLYNELRDLRMVRDDNGDPRPELAFFSPDAVELWKEVYNDHQAECRAPGFPRELEYFWPKLISYLARLSLILAMCRAVSEDTATDRVEGRDVFAALGLVKFFKSHARRVYAMLYGEVPQEVLTYDAAAFLAARGGTFEGTPEELFLAFESRHKPAKAEWLTRKLESIEEIRVETGHASVKAEHTKTGRSTARFIKLALENGVNGVNGVNAMLDWREGGG
jgi:hypothetical protein